MPIGVNHDALTSYAHKEAKSVNFSPLLICPDSSLQVNVDIGVLYKPDVHLVKTLQVFCKLGFVV